MEQTSMRVTKRTVRYLAHLKSVFGLRGDDKKSLDEIVWDAINRAYPDEMTAAAELADDERTK